jgi:single-strand DNA-binding protein
MDNPRRDGSMGSVNKVILVGNLGRDAEVRYTPGGAAVARFSIATTEVWNDKSGQRQERTEWHNIDLWGKQAESLSEYLVKGKQVYIEGRLQTDEYTDKEGQKKKSTKVRCERVVLLGGGRGGGGSSERGDRSSERVSAPASHDEPSEPLTDDDIPF